MAAAHEHAAVLRITERLDGLDDVSGFACFAVAARTVRAGRPGDAVVTPVAASIETVNAVPIGEGCRSP
jgi:hypothetical protein